MKFGAHIKIADEDTDDEFSYQVVGEFEADVKNGRLGINSPIARALIGKKAGEFGRGNDPQGR